jgi:hypothetical protein
MLGQLLMSPFVAANNQFKLRSPAITGALPAEVGMGGYVDWTGVVEWAVGMRSICWKSVTRNNPALRGRTFLGATGLFQVHELE